MNKNSRYQINEKDIDSALNFLKLTDPEHATPEMAISLLEYMQETIHTINDQDPEQLKRIYEELKEQIKLKKN